MKSVYTWRLIYILILFLPSQLRAQPNPDFSLLESYSGAPVLKACIRTKQKPVLRTKKLTSYLGNSALVRNQSKFYPGYLHIMTALNSIKTDFMCFEEMARLQPPMILKDLTLVERLSNT